jgi:TolA-binding protein
VVTDDDASSRPEIGVEVTPVRAEDSSQRAERLPISSTALDPSSAQALFRAANQERRHGNSVEAVRLYRKLQQQFSGSSEATLSLVALGGLLLKSSQAAGALTQFDRYLAGGAKGPLTAEALYGRGQALQRLGRKNEETQNWQRLLKSYPTSPYSFEARRRIDALR